MPVSGYDPDDLEEMLARRIDGRESEFLTDEERVRWEGGESLVDLLDNEEIERILSPDGDGEG